MDICILSIIQKTTLKDFTTNSSKERLYGVMTTLRNMRKRLKGLKSFLTSNLIGIKNVWTYNQYEEKMHSIEKTRIQNC